MNNLKELHKDHVVTERVVQPTITDAIEATNA